MMLDAIALLPPQHFWVELWSMIDEFFSMGTRHPRDGVVGIHENSYPLQAGRFFHFMLGKRTHMEPENHVGLYRNIVFPRSMLIFPGVVIVKLFHAMDQFF